MTLTSCRRLVIAAILLALLLAVVVLAGCGKTEPEKVVEEVHQEANTAATEANLRTIDSAIQMYYMQEGEYPSKIGQLVPTYFKKVPTDPGGGTYYLVKDNGGVKAAVR